MLICEVPLIVRDGLRTVLEAEPDIEVLGAVGSALEAILLARQTCPDVLITGLGLSGVDGLEVVRRFSRERLDPVPRFVVLTMNDSEPLVDQVLKAGVNAVLLSDASREEVSAAVRIAAQGQVSLAPRVAARLVDWFRRQATPPPDESVERQLQELTPREREVLVMVAAGKTVEELAEELYIGVATARTHLYRVRTKLNLRDRAQLVSFAFRAGLVPTVVTDGPITEAS